MGLSALASRPIFSVLLCLVTLCIPFLQARRGAQAEQLDKTLIIINLIDKYFRIAFRLKTQTQIKQ